MVNFDMVGRMRDDQLYVMGVDTGQGLRALVEQAAVGLSVKLSLRGDGAVNVNTCDHAVPFHSHISDSRLFAASIPPNKTTRPRPNPKSPAIA